MSNPWIWPTRSRKRLHVDFAGPFYGGMLFLTVDLKSHWMEIIPMSSTSAGARIKAL